MFPGTKTVQQQKTNLYLSCCSCLCIYACFELVNKEKLEYITWICKYLTHFKAYIKSGKTQHILQHILRAVRNNIRIFRDSLILTINREKYVATIILITKPIT